MSSEAPRWFKSSYSSNGGACLEAADNLAAIRGVVPVRDSKRLEGPVLTFSTDAFSSFVTGVKSGRVSAD
ncbi:DUF397 domain-containing protein [Streptomyces sedi]|uniref:DUF397 domain-containing protein n=1 Tax=Streptomyces sedi TaxID=555059 RepID=A0A5C4VCK9_9ACTN|nr:DUF397 domain-containing protein [Streptomyces sedi]TNM33637.1 DUF397 domain-containing protein [Streptomyces sedi]